MHWYAIPDLPQGRVHVRVFWNGRVFQAARGVNPDTGRLAWCTYRDGDIVWLPPKKEADAWGDAPERWQPIDPARWDLPLPDPLPVQVTPRLYYTQQDFSAAEAAAEMEGARSDARSRKDDGEPVDPRPWRDITNVRYEHGLVSEKMAEWRVLRALAWCGAGKGLTMKVETTATLLARLCEEAAGKIVPDEKWHGVPRFQPLPQDHSDFETAMAWVARLNPPEAWDARRKAWSLNKAQRVLLLRSLDIPLSWGDVANELGLKTYGRNNWTTAQDLYKKSVNRCWRFANARD